MSLMTLVRSIGGAGHLLDPGGPRDRSLRPADARPHPEDAVSSRAPARGRDARQLAPRRSLRAGGSIQRAFPTHPPTGVGSMDPDAGLSLAWARRRARGGRPLGHQRPQVGGFLRLGTLPPVRWRGDRPDADRVASLGSSLLGPRRRADISLSRGRWPTLSVPSGCCQRAGRPWRHPAARRGQDGESRADRMGGPAARDRAGPPQRAVLGRRPSSGPLDLRDPSLAGPSRRQGHLRAGAALVAGARRGRPGHRRGRPCGGNVRFQDEGLVVRRGAFSHGRRVARRRDAAGLPRSIRAVRDLAAALRIAPARPGDEASFVRDRRRAGGRRDPAGCSTRRSLSRPTGSPCTRVERAGASSLCA